MNDYLNLHAANATAQISSFGSFGSSQKSGSAGSGFASELASQQSRQGSGRPDRTDASDRTGRTDRTDHKSGHGKGGKGSPDKVSAEAEATAAAQAAAENTVNQDTPADTTTENAGAEAPTDLDVVVESDEVAVVAPEIPAAPLELQADTETMTDIVDDTNTLPVETSASQAAPATDTAPVVDTHYTPEPVDKLQDLRSAARALADILRQLGIELPANGEVNDKQLPAFVELMLDKLNTAMEDDSQVNRLRVTLYDLQQIDRKLDLPINRNLMPQTIYTGDYLMEALRSRLQELQAQLGLEVNDAEPLALDIDSMTMTTVEPELVSATEDDIDTLPTVDAETDPAPETLPQVADTDTDTASDDGQTAADGDEAQAGATQVAIQQKTIGSDTGVSETRFDANQQNQQPVDPKQVIDQVVKAAALGRNAAGNTRMEIQLSPEFLGKVSVVLTQTKDGLVAQIRTEGDNAQQILSSHMSELQNSLKDMGLNMKKIEVTGSDISWDFARNPGQQNGQQTTDQSQSGLHDRSIRIGRMLRVQSEGNMTALSQALYTSQTLQPGAASAYLGMDASVEFHA